MGFGVLKFLGTWVGMHHSDILKDVEFDIREPFIGEHSVGHMS